MTTPADLRRFAEARGLPWVFSMDQLVEALKDAKPDDSFLFIDEDHLAWSFHKKDLGGAKQTSRIRATCQRRLAVMKATVGVHGS